jgi:DNA-binding transcriptional LysR family regulator
MSHNLARLRTLFGDELLTRAPNGMQATPRALALVDPLRIALAQITGLVSRERTFDPRTAERLFRIGLPDGLEAQFGPALLSHLCEAAPGIRLRLYSTDNDQLFDELDADHLDLAVGVEPLPEGQTHHKRRLLATDTFLCIFNADKVGIAPPISLEDYLRLPHVSARVHKGDEHGLLVDTFARLGLRRRVVVVTQRFLAVPFLVAGAPVVATMHSRIARYFAASLGLSLSPVPVDLPRPSVSLVWHASHDQDPSHQWLRQTLLRLAAERMRSPA